MRAPEHPTDQSASPGRPHLKSSAASSPMRRRPAVHQPRRGVPAGRRGRRLGAAPGITGEPMPPLLPPPLPPSATARSAPGMIAVIRRFLHQLPCWRRCGTRENAEAHLAELATRIGPSSSPNWPTAGHCLNPDGNYTDEDRARRRGLTLGKQDPDGMSRATRHGQTPKCAPRLRRCWPSWPPPACVTPTTTPRALTAHHE